MNNPNINFTRSGFGGYKADEVDEFIAHMSAELEMQRQKNTELTEKMRYLVRVIEDMRAGKEQPADAPASDEEARRVIREANERAAAILAEAARKANRSSCDAESIAAAEKRLEQVRSTTLETVETIARVCTDEAARFAELRRQLTELVISSEESLESGAGKIAVGDTKAQPAPTDDEPTAGSDAPSGAEEELSLDTVSFAALRENIDTLAAEKYIPGQEEPTIVAEDIKSIPVQPVKKEKPGMTEDNAEEAGQHPDEDDGGVRFSLFHR